MNFKDISGLPGAPDDAVAGLSYATEDRQWLVSASVVGPDPEWLVWQRVRPGDRRKGQSQGYVRRLAWCRLTAREQACFLASVLDDLPATGSATVLRTAVRDHLRDMGTGLVFRAIGFAIATARGLRRPEDGA